MEWIPGVASKTSETQKDKEPQSTPCYCLIVSTIQKQLSRFYQKRDCPCRNSQQGAGKPFVIKNNGDGTTVHQNQQLVQRDRAHFVHATKQIIKPTQGAVGVQRMNYLISYVDGLGKASHLHPTVPKLAPGRWTQT
jgi:hypothetical protein